MNNWLCDECGSAKLEIRSIEEVRKYRGTRVQVNFKAHVCVECENDYTLSSGQAKDLTQQLVRAYKIENGLLLGEELRYIRDELLELTQAQFEKKYELGTNTVHRWEKDIIPQKTKDDLFYESLRRNHKKSMVSTSYCFPVTEKQPAIAFSIASTKPVKGKYNKEEVRVA